MSGAYTERLVSIAQQARSLPNGMRGPLYRSAAAELGISVATLHRKLGEVSHRPARKRRADAGNSTLPLAEAQMISALLMETIRGHGKRMCSVENAVIMLRANGKITAARVDEQTGEVKPLANSTILRALRQYGLHPDQLLAPEPAVSLASKHPNHVWQIDASLCVLYYLRTTPGADAGLQVMDAAQFNDNKPKNVAKVEPHRVWRYVITDHASGCIYVHYVLGAESGENLVEVLVSAIQQRGNDPFHGVPFIIMMDPGSANIGALFLSLCRGLQIQTWVNKPGNPRAKGSVEKANDIVEREFETGLRLQPVNSLAELNQYAWRWMRVFNATAIHSRHGMTRWACWMKVRNDLVRRAPPIEVCRELARSMPTKRKVTAFLTVNYKGTEYDVSQVPGVMVGEPVLVATNPYRTDAAQVVMFDEHGHEQYVVIPAIAKDEYGFSESAAVIGEQFKRHGDTPANINRKTVSQIAMGETTEAGVEAARKAKRLPFGGDIDPYKHIDEANLPTFLPRRGQALGVTSPTIDAVRTNPVEAAKTARYRMGDLWTAACYTHLVAHYAEGITEEELDQLISRWIGGSEEVSSAQA